MRVLLLPVTSQQLLLQSQKALLAPASRKYARSELKMQLVHSIWHEIHVRDGEV